MMKSISNLNYIQMGKHQKKEQPPAPVHKQDEKHNHHSKPPTRCQQIVWLLNVIVAVGVVYYLLHFAVTKAYTPIFISKSAQKTQLLQSIGLFTSFVLLLHTFSADWLDVVFNKTQNDLYRTHVNVVNNTILWTTVFVGAYLYRGEEAFGDTGLDILLFDLFLVGRILFSIGYTVGAILGHQSFRSVGFGLGFGCVVIMLTEVLNCSILKHFK